MALREACHSRLRPILMTTMTFVAGMIPLALSTGPGAEERRAAALVIIYGQGLALVVTLVVTPVSYLVLNEIRVLASRAFPVRATGGRVQPNGHTGEEPASQKGVAQ